MTELRRRLIEELRLRNYSSHTITVYLRCVANFAQYFRASPDRLGPEHIREYQLFLVQRKKVSWPLFNQTVCALRFFYHHVLHRNWMIEHIPYPRHEARLPVVLSPAEVAAVFEATTNLKHRTPDDHLCRRLAGFRGHPPAGVGYRQPAPGYLRSSGQGPQGSPGDAVAQAARGTADLLEKIPTQALALSG